MFVQFFNPELGHYLLAFACCLAGAQFIVPLWGYYNKQVTLAKIAAPLALAQWMALSLSFGCLIIAAISDDFSVVTILQNSASNKPLFYKISGLWGNHEGSIFLWIYLLATFNALLAYVKTTIPFILKSLSLAIFGGICAGFNLFCLITSNPFLRIWPAPLDGEGMNPLLQDPILAVHPPLLYAGYVGFSIPFALTIAGLINNQINTSWAKIIKLWVIISWIFLTSGIALGSWWSYYVLGWGGYWFWDPVENVSLITWLLATALLHSLFISERFESLKLWTIFLVISTFSSSIGGTFLVRSGILNSVHAFTADPNRGIFILILLGLITGLSLVLFIYKAPLLSETVEFTPLSKEAIILFHNILLCSITFVVLMGTLYPPLLQAFAGQSLSVGPLFYKKTLTPLAWIGLFFMALGPLLPFKKVNFLTLIRILMFPLIITVIAFIFLSLYFQQLIISITLALCIWVICNLGVTYIKKTECFRTTFSHSYNRWCQLPLSFHGANLAHFGVVITFIGIIGMSFSSHKIVEINQGDQVHFAGFDWTLIDVSSSKKNNYISEQATIQVTDHDNHVAWLLPAIKFYPQSKQFISQTSIHTNMIYNLYAVLGQNTSINDKNSKKLYIFKLYFYPFAPWLWIGCVFMIFGGMICLWHKKFFNIKSSNLKKLNR